MTRTTPNPEELAALKKNIPPTHTIKHCAVSELGRGILLTFWAEARKPARDCDYEGVAWYVEDDNIIEWIHRCS